MSRIFACLLAVLSAALLCSPAWAQDDATATETASAASALLSSARLDLPTLLLASQVLQLLQDDQAGFDALLDELTGSGDLSEAGAAQLRSWLASAGGDYLALLSPSGNLAQSMTGFVGPIPNGTDPTARNTTSRQAGTVLAPSIGPQRDTATGLAQGPGISLSADGTVQVQGVEQLLSLAGLGQVAEAASAAGVVLELDPQNVGVYIPLTVNGAAVSAGQLQLDGVKSELASLLHRMQPSARIYTVPSSWKADANAAWNNLCELLTGKEKKPVAPE